MVYLKLNQIVEIKDKVETDNDELLESVAKNIIKKSDHQGEITKKRSDES